MNPNQKYYSDLLKNILFFSQTLRKIKVGVTIDNVLDALRGTSYIDIQRKRDFYELLKSNFVSHREEIDLFDGLFEQFWSFDHELIPSLKENVEKKLKSSEENIEDQLQEFQKEGMSFLKDWLDEGEEGQKLEQKDVPGYSPDEILGRKDFGHLQIEELGRVKELVSALSRKMAITLSRRWRKGKAGDRLDFRRSIRQSLKYGGEMIELRMKEPKPKPFRLILFCDVSGSMDIYSQFFLLFMYELQNQYPHCETFVFSTRLSRITSILKRKVFEETLRLLSEKVSDWSGGTNIGGALHQFHQLNSHLLNFKRAIFLIFSDGWDRGDTKILESEIKNLKRQVKKLIWLNPLLGSQNYQPLCKGMSTALPYLDYFLPCHNFLSLRNLSNIITKM
jgi:uncharacterized protein with von Willebrand factor type A (vWA) domain